jgi:hypothetical protein
MQAIHRFGPALLALGLLLSISPAGAAELRGEPIQGGLIFGRAAPGSEVLLDGQAIMVSEQGDFVIGFGRDESGERTLLIREPGNDDNVQVLAVAPRDYRIERVDGLPQRTVTPDPEAAERIRQ